MYTMKPEIVYSRWTIIDGMHGTKLYPYEISILDAIQDYGGTDIINEIEVEFAWCYRLSMPGYLDCTEWVGPFAWKHQAERECEETYIEDSPA